MSDPSLQGVRCLVVGAGGFLGGAVARALCDRGAIVQGYGRLGEEDRHRDPRVIWTNALFADVSSLARAVDGQEAVFHFISSSIPESSNRDPADDLLANVFSSIRLLDLCWSAGVRKILFASSGGTVYGIPSIIPTPEMSATDPISAYGIDKLAIEKYVALYYRLHGLDYQILRIANPYGPGQSPFKKQGVVASLLHRAISGQPLEIWGNGEVTRDFIHVDDVVSAFLRLIRYTGRHRIMNVGCGRGRTINELVQDVQQLVGHTLTIERKPGRAVDVPSSILNTKLIRSETQWEPKVVWEDGLRDTLAWLRDAYPG